jgi:hypothetical protein
MLIHRIWLFFVRIYETESFEQYSFLPFTVSITLTKPFMYTNLAINQPNPNWVWSDILNLGYMCHVYHNSYEPLPAFYRSIKSSKPFI